MLWRGWACDSVVCGAADIPIGHSPQDSVGLHPWNVPDGARPGVGHEHRAIRCLAGVNARRIRRVGNIDGQSQAIHPFDGLASEVRQPTLRRLVEASPQGVGVRVGDPDLPQTQAMEYIELVDLVADRGRCFQPEQETDSAVPVSCVDIGELRDHDHG